jgi:hypothetical protein
MNEKINPNLPLELLERLSVEVESAITELDGNYQGILAGYQYFSAKHFAAAARGYIRLKWAGEDAAAQQLLRPMLETWVRIKAVREDSAMLYRIAMGELIEEEKWMKSLDPAGFICDRGAQKCSDRRDQFHDAFVNEFSPKDLVGVPRMGMSIEGLAKVANLWALYNSYYRLLCRCTHGNLTAMTGFFSDIDIKESFLVGAGFSEIMLALKELGASCPNFCALNAEVSAICDWSSTVIGNPAAKTFDPEH